jgi:hypothetical protein
MDATKAIKKKCKNAKNRRAKKASAVFPDFQVDTPQLGSIFAQLGV